MTKLKCFTSLVVGLTTGLLVMSVAQAQPHGKGNGREHGGEICKADAEKLCPGQEMGRGLGKCLKEKLAEIQDTECKAQVEHISAMMAKRKEARQGKGRAFFKACKSEIKTLCKGTKPGDGRIIDCLKEKAKEDSSKISPECKSAMDPA